MNKSEKFLIEQALYEAINAIESAIDAHTTELHQDANGVFKRIIVPDEHKSLVKRFQKKINAWKKIINKLRQERNEHKRSTSNY